MKRIVVALAVLAVVGLLALPSAADAPQTGPVMVRVAGLRSNEGQVGCALYNSAKGYPRPTARRGRLGLRVSGKVRSAQASTAAPVKLGLQPKEMPRILKDGMQKRALKSKGPKRATTYFAT